MGTSAASNGPGRGVPLDPPWLDDLEPGGHFPREEENADNKAVEERPAEFPQIQPVAPSARFSSARRNIGDYVRSGSKDSLRRGLGHYSKKGMGGASSLSRRMRFSAQVGVNLFGMLDSLRKHPDFELGKTLSALREQGADAAQCIHAVIEQVCPRGGSLDEISARDSVTTVLSEYLDKHPNMDIEHLSDDQIWELTGSYLGYEVFNRILMDIGQIFEKSDISIADKISKYNDMRDFIQSEVSVQLNAIRETETQIADMQELLQSTIQKTFSVYEVEV